MKRVKLKDCPFCGKRPRVYRSDASLKYHIACLSCDYRIGAKFLDRIRTRVIKTRWNRRVKE